MFKDVEFISPTKVGMYKKLWAENELFLANIFGFEIQFDADDSGGYVCIVADLYQTSRKALHEFLKMSFANFMNSEGAKHFRNSFFESAKIAYQAIANEITDKYISRLGYQDKFYWHQTDGLITSIPRKYNLLSFQMQMGKSITAASKSKALKIRRTVIVCPTTLKWKWMTELVDKWNYNIAYFSILDASKRKSMIAFQERFVIINYEMVGRFKKYLMREEIGHLIIDECFVFDTLIHTDKGLLKIGDIVENKVNCNALSYDSLNNVYSYRPVTNFWKKESKKRIVKIVVNGKEVLCTEDHKIWTSKGFKRANSLSSADFVCMVREEKPKEKQRYSDSNILQHQVFNESSPIRSDMACKIVGSTEKSKASCCIEVPDLSKGNVFNKIRSSSFLQHFVFSKMENVAARNTKICIFKNKRSSWAKKGSQAISINLCKVQRESEKEVAYSRVARKYNESSSGQNLFKQRRQWSDNKTAESSSRFNRMGNGTSNNPERCSELFRVRSQELQSGSSHTETQNSDRSGWLVSQIEKMDFSGSPQNGDFEFFRVESCEILECGSGQGLTEMYREGHVYDIEVDGNHNYFANGVLVSNCTKLKNHNTGRYKYCRALVEEFPDMHVTLLSGTPIKNRVNDIFAYYKLIGNPLAENYTKFCRDYTVAVETKGGAMSITGGKNLDELRVKMSNFMIRRTRDECMDLPPVMKNVIRFQLDDFKDEYNKIVQDMIKSGQVSALPSNMSSLNIITAKSKLEGLIELIETVAEEGRKAYVFCSNTEPLHMLKKHFEERCVMVDGSVDASKRSGLADKFTTDPSIDFFFANTLTVEGLSLQVCSDVYALNFPMTHSELDQAQDRVMGIGQQPNVVINYLVCDGTVDEDLLELIASKDADSTQVIDGGKGATDYKNISEILFQRALERYQKEHPGENLNGKTEIEAAEGGSAE
jgi:Intein splicing domain/SNF2-related domain